MNQNQNRGYLNLPLSLAGFKGSNPPRNGDVFPADFVIFPGSLPTVITFNYLSWLGSGLCALAVLSGCAMQGMAGGAPAQILAQITISGGSVIKVPFTQDGPEHAEDDRFRIEKATLQVNPTKRHGFYEFVLIAKGGTVRSVMVDDVSDDMPVRILEDFRPLPSGSWEGRSTPFTIAEDSVKWLYDQDNTVRVYRFTIDDGSATKDILYQASAYPAFLKHGILTSLAPETL